MNRRTAFVNLLSAVTLWAAVAVPLHADTSPHPSAGATAAVDKVLSDAVARHDTPGVVGLVVDRSGVLFQGAAGQLDVGHAVPLTGDAIFNIASMTKPITSVAIMILREQGKLQLDDPVSKYLPGFDDLKVITKFNPADGSFQTRPAKRTMTLRHLLTHTSGIGYGFSSAIVARLQQGNHKSEWELPLLHDPGTKWTYGASTRVLGLIVEKISGETLEAFDQEHILGPLGMVDTSYAVPAQKQARIITTHRRVDGQLQEQPRGNIPVTPTAPFGGDGGLYSTAQDYGRFMRMLLNGGRLGNVRILSAQSVALMSRNQIGAVFVSKQPAANPALTRPFPIGADRDKFGLGFEITGPGVDGKSRSPGSLAWAGIFNTEFWVDPKAGIGGVLLMQYLPFYDEGAIRTLRDFEAAVYGQLLTP